MSYVFKSTLNVYLLLGDLEEEWEFCLLPSSGIDYSGHYEKNESEIYSQILKMHYPCQKFSARETVFPTTHIKFKQQTFCYHKEDCLI